MEGVSYKMALIDALSHTVLLVDGPGGEILAEFPLPDGHKPIDLTLCPASHSIYISLAANKTSGALAILDLQTLVLNIVTPALPKPVCFALRPGSQAIYLADPEGTVHLYDPAAALLSSWVKPATALHCVGLAGCREGLHAVWETECGGILATYDHAGKIVSQHTIGGIPTGITLTQAETILIPFTASQFSSEGVFILSLKEKKSAVINLHCPCCDFTKAYPIHAAVSPDGKLAYVVCEDNASIAIIDVASARLCDSFSLGRSLSRLALIPGGKLAIASSNMFADLCLVDLVNKRAVSFTDTRREILSPLAIIN